MPTHQVSSPIIKAALRFHAHSIVALEQYMPVPMDFREVSHLLWNPASQNCLATVALAGTQVIGYCAYLPCPWHLELVRICVHPEFRRLGIGTRLVVNLLETMNAGRKGQVTCFVPDNNPPMHLFLRSNGFTVSNILHGQYIDSYADTYKFVRLRTSLKT